MTDDDFLQDYKRRTLEEHVSVGEQKPISYLPLKTIENVLGLSIEEYQRKVESVGNKCLILSKDETCIQSGAVYAYSATHLRAILDGYSELLAATNWPTSPEEFVRRIAVRWCDDDEPIMPVIRAVFGDRDKHSFAMP